MVISTLCPIVKNKLVSINARLFYKVIYYLINSVPADLV